MPVISNTSPLLNLAIINQLSLIKEQFREIIIPNAVLKELRINEDIPGSSQLREALEADWIIVKQVENEAFVQLLRRELDQGEAEAIALAIELQADWVLLDERDGRKIARSLGLNITGVLGIILRGWQQGNLSSVREIINQLRTEAHFHIAPNLENQILRETRELNN
jgi:predicted nucleic acid-binding protein